MTASDVSVTTNSRPRHTDLQPLTTQRIGGDRRLTTVSTHDNQSSGPLTAPDSAISLASPTLLAVRQYYRDNGLSTAFQASPITRRDSAPQMLRKSPRRQSSISSPGGLAARFGGVSVSSPLVEVSTLNDAASIPSIAEETRKQLLDGLNEGELAQLGSAVARRRSSIQTHIITQASGMVPFEYTHERLRQWGHVYLGDVGTADAFVKALHQRRSDGIAETKQMTPEKDSNINKSNNDSIVIRARVIPKSKGRKPFLIQRKFDVEGLRASVFSPNVSTDDSEDSAKEVKHAAEDKATGSKNSIVKSDDNIRRLRSRSIPSKQSGNKERAYPDLEKLGGSPSRRIMPIRVFTELILRVYDR